MRSRSQDKSNHRAIMSLSLSGLFRDIRELTSLSLARYDQQLRTKENLNQHLPQSEQDDYAISHYGSLVINDFAF